MHRIELLKETHRAGYVVAILLPSLKKNVTVDFFTVRS
jgi:hypothetical protein